MQPDFTFTIGSNQVPFYLNQPLEQLSSLASKSQTILLTDEEVYRHHQPRFEGWRTIIIKSGEIHKQFSVIQEIIEQLIHFEADRHTWLIGIGGGVVTDIAGFAAGVYMRGIRCAFVPTTLLAMVDASLGGKNGVDMGLYKNLAGLIRQPQFLLYDYTLLETLPEAEWENGFAEIIKHACIRDAALFAELEQNNLNHYRNSIPELARLIEKNVRIKMEIVAADETEKGDRKLLNFGHTYGHAIENLYHFPHGHAISIGMVTAARISEEISQLSSDAFNRISSILRSYGLPTQFTADQDEVFDLLKMDKKRNANQIDFILLKAIGEAHIQPVHFEQLQDLLRQVIP